MNERKLQKLVVSRAFDLAHGRPFLFTRGWEAIPVALKDTMFMEFLEILDPVNPGQVLLGHEGMIYLDFCLAWENHVFVEAVVDRPQFVMIDVHFPVFDPHAIVVKDMEAGGMIMEDTTHQVMRYWSTPANYLWAKEVLSKADVLTTSDPGTAKHLREFHDHVFLLPSVTSPKTAEKYVKSFLDATFSPLFQLAKAHYGRRRYLRFRFEHEVLWQSYRRKIRQRLRKMVTWE